MKLNPLFAACVAALTLSACGGSEEFKATLSGATERPTPVTTSGTGSVTATLKDKTLTVSGTFSNLSAAATAAHIHGPANKESAADVVCPLTATAAASGNITGTCTFTDAQVQQLKDGMMYVNVHTSTNMAGELRGQLE
ncbi:MAG TPA: CHRD domain-containing protein [Archangium sp.]|nr:CHRD domain-containing protein [Archangium sp.]